LVPPIWITGGNRYWGLPNEPKRFVIISKDFPVSQPLNKDFKSSVSTINRYALILEYDGSFFSGWQWQKDKPSVQTTLEQAIRSLVGEDIRLYAAGRTDSGVHALGQVAHMDLSRVWPLDALRRGLNFYLKDIPIKIIQVCQAPHPFHARFSALSRHYQYIILNRSSASALIEKRAWWVPVPLNRQAMIEGCAYLQGHHDFSYFRHRDCQSASPWKTVDSLTLEDGGDNTLVIRVTARSFLHRQVRIMVGALVALGRGQWGCDHLVRLLNPGGQCWGALDQPQLGTSLIASSADSLDGLVARNLGENLQLAESLESSGDSLDLPLRGNLGKKLQRATTAPAHGLYLTRVDYGPDWPHFHL
jgi:tRNA pseudouridine38-40 synthase